MKLIDKDAVVAEIEKTRKALNLNLRHDQGVCDGLYAIQKYIDTLEVKEVDLEKEVYAYMVNEIKFLSDEVRYDTLSTIARHFFELGLKARKQ